MIKKFKEYIKTNEELSYGEYDGDLNEIEDIDYTQMNKLPNLYKRRYKALIEYDIILPDKGIKETKEIAKNIIENDIKKMTNVEVSIKEVNEINLLI